MSYFRRGRALSGVDVGMSSGAGATGPVGTSIPRSRGLQSGATTVFPAPGQGDQVVVKTPPVIVDCLPGYFMDPASGQCVLAPIAPSPGNYVTPTASPVAAAPRPWLLYGGLAVAGILVLRHLSKGQT